MSALQVTTDVARREIVLTRDLAAPREVVWRAWTTREHLEAWWGPKGWVTTVRALDVRPGRLWHFGMGPEDAEPEVWIRAVYSEVIDGSSLSYVEGFSDEAGADLDPDSNSVTVDFIEQGPAQTRLLMHIRFTSIARLEQIVAQGVVEGYEGAFDRLDIHTHGQGEETA